MKLQPLFIGFTATAIALSPITIFNQLGYANNANSITFRCINTSNQPRTILQAFSGNANPQTKVIFHWYRAFPNPQRAQQLCQSVSDKLQTRSKGVIHLSFGQGQDGKYGMCLAKIPDGSCSSTNEMLFTLAPTEDHAFVKSKLPDVALSGTYQGYIRNPGKERVTVFGMTVPFL
ncbi:COP23 domain-containing protein [Floridanema aerugineum]|uniref:COP23 domain-containing protein n=1 Tax=Floridaenema aerugineum BLCC-F46 TaxID=3153654 RepID=A0ABV4X779_9CYAN